MKERRTDAPAGGHFPDLRKTGFELAGAADQHGQTSIGTEIDTFQIAHIGHRLVEPFAGPSRVDSDTVAMGQQNVVACKREFRPQDSTFARDRFLNRFARAVEQLERAGEVSQQPLWIGRQVASQDASILARKDKINSS